MEILDFAGRIPDFRQEVKVQHQAYDIVFITIASVICGAQDWKDVSYFRVCKESFFRQYLERSHGIPSHDSSKAYVKRLKELND